MPVYEFSCNECNNEWDDIIAYSDPNPNCPECNTSNVKRLISLIAHGKVKLEGQAWHDAVKRESQKAIQESHRNENLLANLVGEDKYQSNLTDKPIPEKPKKEVQKDITGRPKIKSSNK